MKKNSIVRYFVTVYFFASRIFFSSHQNILFFCSCPNKKTQVNFDGLQRRKKDSS